jgi:prolyl oligopeptidase
MIIVVKCYADELPGLGSAGGFSGKKKRKHCIILLLITRRELPIHLKLKKEISSISKPKVDFKSEDFESKQVFYTSKMEQNSMIIYKRIEIDGKIQPCLWLWGF